MAQGKDIKALKAGAPVSKNWRAINEISEVLNASGLVDQSNAGKLAGLLNRPRDLYVPFMIYFGGSWLTVRVTGGLYITTGDPITVTNTETDLTLTSGLARHWVYVELSATTGQVLTSTTTLTWSPTKVPLGFVNTTDTVNQRSLITQFYPLHLFNPCVT
jgi:hypothetical protein